MRQAIVKVHDVNAGILTELGNPSNSKYRFQYLDDYAGAPVSLTMPDKEKTYDFDHFPPFFEGLLPEGGQLEGLLRIHKIDRYDLLSQLLAVGHDLVGAVTVFEHE